MSDPTSLSRPWNQGEPSLGELLSDPVCRLLMQSDGVTPQRLSALLDRLQANQCVPGRPRPSLLVS